MKMRLTAIAVLAATLLLSVPFTGVGMAADGVRTNGQWFGAMTSTNEMTVVYECDAQATGAVVAITLRCELVSGSQVWGSATSTIPGPVTASAGTARVPLSAGSVQVCAHATAHMANGTSFTASTCT